MRFQWRRGLLLAGVHLALCAPLIVLEEADRWDWVRSQENLPPLELPRPVPPPPPDAVKPVDEGETITFSPCGMWYHTSIPQKVILYGELPAAVASGYVEPCPPAWSLAGLIGTGWPNHDSRRKELEFSIVFCGLIALQWILVGGFPLIRPRRWFEEPGALITIFACTGILALATPLLWMIWLVLLTWSLLQAGYRRAVMGWRFFRRDGS